MIDLLYGTGDNTSLLVIISQSEHRESFSRSGLTIAHNGSIVSCDDVGDDLSRCQVVNIILRGVQHDIIEFEFPIIQLIVDGSLIFFVHVNIEFTSVLIDFQICGGEIVGWPRSNVNLNGLL